MLPETDRCPLGPIVGECRGRLATLLAVREAPRVALVAGVTHALNAALWGIELRRRAERKSSPAWRSIIPCCGHCATCESGGAI